MLGIRFDIDIEYVVLNALALPQQCFNDGSDGATTTVLMTMILKTSYALHHQLIAVSGVLAIVIIWPKSSSVHSKKSST